MHLDVGAGASRINWLRRRNAAAGYDHHNYDDHARGDHGSSDERGCDARGRSAAGAANGAN